MRAVRNTFKVKGVEVEMLFTPRLYMFEGVQGITFKDRSVKTLEEVTDLYADVMFCASLNYLTLTGKKQSDMKLQRVDFYEWKAQQPDQFVEAMDFALQALTGKSLKDYQCEAQKAAEAEETPKEGEKKKKKRFSVLNMQI